MPEHFQNLTNCISFHNQDSYKDSVLPYVHHQTVVTCSVGLWFSPSRLQMLDDEACSKNLFFPFSCSSVSSALGPLPVSVAAGLTLDTHIWFTFIPSNVAVTHQSLTISGLLASLCLLLSVLAQRNSNSVFHVVACYCNLQRSVRD